MSKECVPSVLVRRNKTRGQVASRVARLEEKLDDLVSFLKADKNIGGRTTDRDRAELEESSEEDDDEDASPNAIPTPTSAITTDNGRRATTTWPSNAASPASWSLSAVDEPSASEADEYLRKFRDETIVSAMDLSIALCAKCSGDMARR